MPETLPFTGDPDADRYLAEEPLALLVGMLLDQQVPMEWAFRSPWVLRERLGGSLEAGRIAAMGEDDVIAVFAEKPALHRYPGSMAKRVRELCGTIAEEYGGDASRVWRDAADAKDLYQRLRGLPGFGDEKARIFVKVVGLRLGAAPPGWEEFAIERPSVADVDGPGAIEKVREAKAAWKAANS
jgi:uncharacterized HhH-GPD family protein